MKKVKIGFDNEKKQNHLNHSYKKIEILNQAIEIFKTQTNKEPENLKEFEKGFYKVIEIEGDSMNDGTNRSICDGDK